MTPALTMNKEVISKIREIKKLADEILASPSVNQKGSKLPTLTHSRPGTISASATLPEHILQLREAGFFRTPRTSQEVHTKLSKTYSCLLNRVTMALKRLQRRKELRKAEKNVEGEKQIAYVV